MLSCIHGGGRWWSDVAHDIFHRLNSLIEHLDTGGENRSKGFQLSGQQGVHLLDDIELGPDVGVRRRNELLVGGNVRLNLDHLDTGVICMLSDPGDRLGMLAAVHLESVQPIRDTLNDGVEI